MTDRFSSLPELSNPSMPVETRTACKFDPSVQTAFLEEGTTLPLVVQPAHAGLSPVTWATSQRGAIETALCRYGAILFRGFDLPSIPAFEAFAEALSPGLYGKYGDLPKKGGGNNIYHSTPYPEQDMILYHNESAHLDRWPRKQFFFCEQPSIEGGATPLVDIRQMLARMPDTLVDLFEQRGLAYIRTFQPGLDVSWQAFFHTDSRDAVEASCRAAGTEFRWLDGKTFQMRTACPAVIRHPVTGERGFFNQVQLHHPYCLGDDMRDDLIDLCGIDGLPRNVCFGDGAPIPDDVMETLGELYEICAVRFEWRKGDVAMLDNMLVAHARDPYTPPRQIAVAMGEMVERSTVWE